MTELNEDQQTFIAMMIPMYIEARYPSYKKKIASTLTEQSCKYILETTQQMKQWIHEKLLVNSRLSIS
ncbi:MAG: HEPN domain-containing protein [Bacteroidaceae bacterium]|nr:HEPN domain-containing protein [Bacteroidaceae bacterium]